MFIYLSVLCLGDLGVLREEGPSSVEHHMAHLSGRTLRAALIPAAPEESRASVPVQLCPVEGPTGGACETGPCCWLIQQSVHPAANHTSWNIHHRLDKKMKNKWRFFTWSSRFSKIGSLKLDEADMVSLNPALTTTYCQQHISNNTFDFSLVCDTWHGSTYESNTVNQMNEKLPNWLSMKPKTYKGILVWPIESKAFICIFRQGSETGLAYKQDFSVKAIENL